MQEASAGLTDWPLPLKNAQQPGLRSSTRPAENAATNHSRKCPENEESCFRVLPSVASSTLVSVSGPPCDCLLGLNVVWKGQIPQVAATSPTMATVRKARLLLRGTKPRWEGNDQGQCWGHSICSKAFAPFSSCGYCYFPLTSCLQARGKDRMGNTAAIQWRLMPEMSHTSEQLLPIRGTALNGQRAPLMTVIKEVKACAEGKKGFTLPPQT